MLIRVFDFETTGMAEEGSQAAICEIGWTDVIVSEDPDGPRHPHISDADVADAISPIDGLARMKDGAPQYFSAHNSRFEEFFFGHAATPWLDTYRVGLRLYTELPAYSNQAMRYCLGIELPNEAAGMPPHRAGPDSYVTAHILAKMIEEGRALIEDMARWSSGPPLMIKVTFGKHKGGKWEDLPHDYLEWIINKSDLDSDTKANARYYLKKKRTPA